MRSGDVLYKSITFLVYSFLTLFSICFLKYFQRVLTIASSITFLIIMSRLLMLSILLIISTRSFNILLVACLYKFQKSSDNFDLRTDSMLISVGIEEICSSLFITESEIMNL